jgi:3-oxoacyl-[acyl-carrier protein] reductase
MDLGLTNRVAVVGGGSKGIGRASAMLLAHEGARVVIAARGLEALAHAAEAIRDATGAQVLSVQCDMASDADIKNLVARSVEAFGGLDIVVNNAGGPPPGRFDAHDDAAWQQAFALNLMSVVRLTREALPHLRKSGQGRVINITSTAVKEPIDGLILSNAVRLGTTGLAKTLSKEFGGYGITVNNVGPGLTMTDRIRPVIEAQAKAAGRTFEEVAAEREARIPLGRMAQPEDVAAMVVFLASKQARQITGQTILVDGGSTAAVM